MNDALAGTPTLLRLALRRDRVLLPVWVAALVLSSVSSVRATVGLYPDLASREEAARGINGNPALVAIYGPIADVHSVGAVATFKLLLLGGVFVAMLGSVLVRRHTRLEEESGRAEMLASTVVGRHALLAAALAEAVLAALVTGLLTALGNTAAGLDLAGSLTFGLAWTGLGLAGAGVTALCCQLTSSTRTAGGLVALVLGAGYVLRAVGDLSAGWLTWLSPFGWASRMGAYGEDRWWVSGLLVLSFVLTVGGAVRLAERRDVGAGLFADRPGPASGSLGSVTALTLRLHRPGFLAWALGVFALGCVMGGIAPGVKDMVGSGQAQDLFRRMGGAGGLVDAFLATEFSFLAVGVTAFAVAAVVRVRRGGGGGPQRGGPRHLHLTPGAAGCRGRGGCRRPGAADARVRAGRLADLRRQPVPGCLGPATGGVGGHRRRCAAVRRAVPVRVARLGGAGGVPAARPDR